MLSGSRDSVVGFRAGAKLSGNGTVRILEVVGASRRRLAAATTRDTWL